MELVESLYEDLISPTYKVLNIFNEFFGKEYVDLQGNIPSLDKVKEDTQIWSPSQLNLQSLLHFYYNQRQATIMVWFPQVRVTNENDKSVDIKDMYVKILIDLSGRLLGTFRLNRATYDTDQFNANYMHSHVAGIPFNHTEEFSSSCLGSGPINSTIANLNREFDEDIWKLFCLELKKYLETESLEGVPYHKLESILTGNTFEVYSNLYYNTSSGISYFPKVLLAKFTLFLIKEDILKINYTNGTYSIALPINDYILKVSNAFIKWYNKEFTYCKESLPATMSCLTSLCRYNIIHKYMLSNGKFYGRRSERPNSADTYTSYIGRKICTFKGKDILLNITESVRETPAVTEVYILDSQIISYITTKILNVINYKYGRKEERNNSGRKIRFI